MDLLTQADGMIDVARTVPEFGREIARYAELVGYDSDGRAQWLTAEERYETQSEVRVRVHESFRYALAVWIGIGA